MNPDSFHPTMEPDSKSRTRAWDRRREMGYADTESPWQTDLGARISEFGAWAGLELHCDSLHFARSDDELIRRAAKLALATRREPVQEAPNQVVEASHVGSAIRFGSAFSDVPGAAVTQMQDF